MWVVHKSFMLRPASRRFSLPRFSLRRVHKNYSTWKMCFLNRGGFKSWGMWNSSGGSHMRKYLREVIWRPEIRPWHPSAQVTISHWWRGSDWSATWEISLRKRVLFWGRRQDNVQMVGRKLYFLSQSLRFICPGCLPHSERSDSKRLKPR